MRSSSKTQPPSFCFTIIDDTDEATLANVAPVYRLLEECDLFTTKTVWVYPPRDGAHGASLDDHQYRAFVSGLKDRGFEIASHSVGSGPFTRAEILSGFETFRQVVGYYPRVHANHSYNPDSLYGGPHRFSRIYRGMIQQVHPSYSTNFQGSVSDSPHFWGDFAKQHIHYIRNYETTRLNTRRFDPIMPYIDPARSSYANFWFSTTFAPNPWMFSRIVTKKAIDNLERMNGVCILNTHLGYFMRNGAIDPYFEEAVRYLRTKENGLYRPVSVILDDLRQRRAFDPAISLSRRLRMEFSYLARRFYYKYAARLDDRTFIPSLEDM